MEIIRSRQRRTWMLLLLLLVGLSEYGSVAFTRVPLRTAGISESCRTIQPAFPPERYQHNERRRRSLKVASLSSRAALFSTKKLIFGVCSALVASVAFFVRQKSSLLYPGVRRDPNFDEPLPPASLGCPFLGQNILKGSRRQGPEYFYQKASERLGHPRIWTFYFLGRPVATLTGASLVSNVLSQEFTTLGPMQGEAVRKENERPEAMPAVFGIENLMFERNKERHAFLRKLVGSGMTPASVNRALPTIQQIASSSIGRMLSQPESPIKMEDICTDYTMEIVQRQLLGLDTAMDSAERVECREKLATWLSALYSVVANLQIPFLVKRSRAYKAREFIESKLQDKIDSLLKNGPDTSTLSAMVFAVDSHEKKLTREQVIENALLLVIAGTETSASTLTLAMLLLGLHPEAYATLVQEQDELRSKHGDNLHQDDLDSQECPYLNAVVKEALRLGAVTGGFPRRTRETLILNGVQIPKGWSVFPSIRLTHQLDPVSRLPDDSHMDVRKGFVPERWLNSETVPADFLPFGAGPRYCLGSNLALMEIKVFLALFARRVKSFYLVGAYSKGDIEWNPKTMIPKPLDGVQIEIGD